MIELESGVRARHNAQIEEHAAIKEKHRVREEKLMRQKKLIQNISDAASMISYRNPAFKECVVMCEKLLQLNN